MPVCHYPFTPLFSPLCRLQRLIPFHCFPFASPSPLSSARQLKRPGSTPNPRSGCQLHLTFCSPLTNSFLHTPHHSSQLIQSAFAFHIFLILHIYTCPFLGWVAKCDYCPLSPFTNKRRQSRRSSFSTSGTTTTTIQSNLSPHTLLLLLLFLHHFLFKSPCQAILTSASRRATSVPSKSFLSSPVMIAAPIVLLEIPVRYPSSLILRID